MEPSQKYEQDLKRPLVDEFRNETKIAPSLLGLNQFRRECKRVLELLLCYVKGRRVISFVFSTFSHTSFVLFSLSFSEKARAGDAIYGAALALAPADLLKIPLDFGKSSWILSKVAVCPPQVLSRHCRTTTRTRWEREEALRFIRERFKTFPDLSLSKTPPLRPSNGAPNSRTLSF